jgi:PmbA protein
VLYEGRQASCSTSDVSAQAIDELINTAVEMARLTSVDEDAVLPAREELASGALPDLSLYDQAVAELPDRAQDRTGQSSRSSGARIRSAHREFRRRGLRDDAGAQCCWRRAAGLRASIKARSVA